ncbi:MAG: alkaline phosphatase family protein [Gammaproteobacteria bacterium]|nr:alkaline phosphatase family protein [Gammaproteobacteria bacterium]
MTTSNRLLIIGLDAADRHLVQRWAADGNMPNMGRLFDTAAWGDSRNPTGMVSGTVWPTFYTGVMPGRTGRFRGTTQFVSGTYVHADVDYERHSYPEFWNLMSDQGRTCTVIDAPYAFLSSAPHVTQLVDWCSHSPWKDGVTESTPSELASDVRQRYGRDPVGKCDFAPLDDTADFRRFTNGLLRRIQTKTDMTLDMLADSDAEVFLNVFSECHCAGHQLWHLHDPAHPLHDPEMLRELGEDPLQTVYRAIDTALGRILDGVDSATRVMVFCSHGIGPAYSGTHLLDEILLRLEGKASPRRRQGLAQVMVATWTRMPQAVRTFFTPLQKKLWPKLKANLVQPGKSRRKYFEIIINDASGGIRLNVRGREPDGIVDPGPEYDEICAMLERELLAVENPSTGQPLVKRVLRARELYQGEHAEMLPDLMVIWNRVGHISEARSTSIGHITRKFVFTNHRTGDHTEDDGLFFLTGAGITAGRLDEVSVADLAPTIAALIGFDLPDADGKAIRELAATAEPTLMADAG